MRKNTFSLRALLPAVFLLAAVDLVITAFFQKEYYRAQIEVPAFVINALLLFGLMSFVIWWGEPAALGKGLHFLLVNLFSFSAGCTALRTERFFRFTSDTAYAALGVYVVMAGLLFYLLRGGMETTLRLANLLFWPFAASIGLLLLANLGQMEPENLILEPFSAAEIGRAAWSDFALSPVLLLLLICLQGDRKEKRAAFGKFFWMFLLLTILLKIGEEMVLGEQAAQQTQILHSLSRLGRISVFKRMDALHVWIWSMVEFAKVALYACMIQRSVLILIPSCRHPSGISLICLCAGLFAAMICPESWQQPLQSAVTALILAGIVFKGRRCHRAEEKAS